MADLHADGIAAHGQLQILTAQTAEPMDAGRILIQHGLLTTEQLAEASRASQATDRIDQTAVALGLLREADALRAMGAELGLALIDLETADIDTALLSQFPQKLIHRHAIFPVCRRNGSILIATSDPLDLYPMDEASAAMDCPVEPVLATQQEIANRTTEHLGVGSETIEGLLAQREEDELELLGDIPTDDSELSEESQEASVVRLVNEILIGAIDARASDVHIESQESGIKIRYRIDGQLHPQPMPPEIHQFQSAIISRLKIMARLNIAEKRLPQDGRIKLRVHNREVDVRVSILPTINGEGIVMRLLDRQNMEISLDNLGMEAELRRQFEELIRLPHGIILVTGPTGSGKSTTLAAIVDECNKNRKDHILTIEDPIEFVHKSQKCIVNHREVGTHTRSFAAALRGALREDPDIIMVGEMRDLETISLAMEAAMTGHLVFATLHTINAMKTVDRIIEIFPANQQGQVRSTLADALKAVVSQTLFKRTDIKGRCAALEILIATPAVRNLIRDAKTYQILSTMQTGKKYGMQTLDDAIMQFLEKKMISSDDAYSNSVEKSKFLPFLKRTPSDFTEV